jgi:hypothetical protein
MFATAPHGAQKQHDRCLLNPLPIGGVGLIAVIDRRRHTRRSRDLLYHVQVQRIGLLTAEDTVLTGSKPLIDAQQEPRGRLLGAGRRRRRPGERPQDGCRGLEAPAAAPLAIRGRRSQELDEATSTHMNRVFNASKGSRLACCRSALRGGLGNELPQLLQNKGAQLHRSRCRGRGSSRWLVLA